MGVPDIAAVTRDLVRDYQTHLHEETNDKGEAKEAATQNNALRGIKLFFRFLKEEDYLAQDPSRDVPYAKTPKRLPRSILTRKEVSKLLRSPDTHSLMGYRDRAMLEVFYSTGVRNSELGALKVEDVDTVEGFVIVKQRQGSQRPSGADGEDREPVRGELHQGGEAPLGEGRGQPFAFVPIPSRPPDGTGGDRLDCPTVREKSEAGKAGDGPQPSATLARPR